MTVNKLIWVATIVSIATFQFWEYLPKGSFYVGIGVVSFLFSYIIFIQNKHLFVSFFLLCITFSNLVDELFFNPTKTGFNEFILVVILPIVWHIKRKKMPERIANSEFYIFLSKVIFPAFVAVTMKILIEVKILKMKMTWFNVFFSTFLGLGAAYISSDYVLKNCEKDFYSITFALIAILSEKIFSYIVLKVKVDAFVEAFFSTILDSIIKFRKK